MLYFLLRAGSYRAGCKGPPLMLSYVCVHFTHPFPQVCTHTCHEAANVHGLFQVPVPLWSVGWAADRATKASPDKPRAPYPNATLPADHKGRASPVSCLQTMFSAGWRAAGLCQTPSGSNKRGSSGQWVWHTHTQHHHLILKTSPHLPSMSLGTTSLWQGPQSTLAPLPSCSTWQARGSHGSTGEGVGIWGCSFANSHCKPWQDKAWLSSSGGFHSCLAPDILLVCPRHSPVLLPGIIAGQWSHTPGCLSPPAQYQVPGCNTWLTDSCRSSPGQQSPSELRSR